MLRYLYQSVIFKEIPNEITLGISITGCQIRCKGCHSRELWEDKGIPLTTDELDKLLSENEGITCLCLFGGEHDIDFLITLLLWVGKKWKNIKRAWYCGLDFVPKNKQHIFDVLDYVKVGHYDSELGGLDNPHTNQRLYQISHRIVQNELYDITECFRHISF